MNMQTGDVPATWAKEELLKTVTGYRSLTDLWDGTSRFLNGTENILGNNG
jgi:UDP-glucuronate 4-epimerase